MAITTEAGYITAKAAGVTLRINKASIANQAAGNIASLWRATGWPAQPAIPGAAAVCDRTTAGALELPAVAGANSRYIDELLLSATVAGTLHLADRVIHSGGLSGIVTTAQAVNTPALPARAPAAACEWYLECYTDLGATGVNATCAVTNTDTSTSNIVVAIPATWRASRVLPIPPASGKVIASLQNITLSASTGTAGSFGVTVIDRSGVAACIVAASVADRAAAMLRQVATDACLQLLMDCTTTSTGQVLGHAVAVEG